MCADMHEAFLSSVCTCISVCLFRKYEGSPPRNPCLSTSCNPPTDTHNLSYVACVMYSYHFYHLLSMSCDISKQCVCVCMRLVHESLGLLHLFGKCLVLHVHLCQLLSHLVMNLHELPNAPVKADSLSFAQVTVMVTRWDTLLLTGGGQSEEGGEGVTTVYSVHCPNTHLLYRSVIMSTSISENNSCCLFASMLDQYACAREMKGNSL